MLSFENAGKNADKIFPPGSNPINVLNRKWITVPAGNSQRVNSLQMLKMSTRDLVRLYEEALNHDTVGSGFGIRGWFHEIYSGLLVDKAVLDVGAGLGISSIFFAKEGSRVHFSDIVEPNLEIISRICKYYGVHGEYSLISSFEDYLKINKKFDFILALGSLLNTPLAISKVEFNYFSTLAQSKARYLHLSYPKSRWLKEGRLRFDKWGEYTDGPGTPWIEYHDKEKMEYILGDVQSQLIFDCEFHNSDFNWFDYEISQK